MLAGDALRIEILLSCQNNGVELRLGLRDLQPPFVFSRSMSGRSRSVASPKTSRNFLVVT